MTLTPTGQAVGNLVASRPAKEHTPMASSSAIQGNIRADWVLMRTIHDALRRDLDELLHSTASRSAARARWIVFRNQLRFHLTAERAVMWPLARAKLTGDTHGKALLDAMEDEHQLIGPLYPVTDDAFAMDTDSLRFHQLLTRLRARLTSHLAHEEADALPLIARVMSQAELAGIAKAIRGGNGVRQAAVTVPWALAYASSGVRTQVLSQLPAPARLLYRTVWLPRYTRSTRRCADHSQPRPEPLPSAKGNQ
jgi:iron-sulfur cluster repair protein YtfE (RIC family)